MAGGVMTNSNLIGLDPSAKKRYLGFGAPSAYGSHVFRVIVPAGMTGNIIVQEDYGYLAGINGTPDFEIRAMLPRSKWKLVAETAKRDFNARLRSKKVSISTWKPQDNYLDRMLGKELCVLVWAVEHAANDDEIEVICRKWRALRPEERWWLYTVTAAEGGLAEDSGRGWRKALYLALSDGQAQPKPKKKVPENDPRSIGLFDSLSND
jgi:hypothetical protein